METFSAGCDSLLRHLSGILFMSYGDGKSWTRFYLEGCGVLSLPFFAMYFALCVKNVILAVVLTCMLMFFSSVIGFGMLWLIQFLSCDDFYSNRSSAIGIAAGNMGLALMAYFRLRHNLSRRIYSF